MELRLNVRGASDEEKQRGIEAAKAVFAAAGISAEQAADGMFALEGWDDASCPEDGEPLEEEDNAATVWMDANKAAIRACCADWPADEVPPHLLLELVD
ncbi:hypothetical protein EJ066_27560 [Mesorhizobium sp. M9A.F.Ca.ET.002.03.1.2]|uniref:hypothetical protein n=1 Tax=Mesorhizobium sp. M9A.F.Ca.ET.002.03.1.2 TaxID=2493668 RepID=UPI000F75C46B|nr:hypothetical protein [Mesorhizobium sp. M9A.F.Ca.ET.002.03.1.2]AZO00575.1 hypothetical protein EJ066_27560 [Mesorhizobium sp. M9A.F.Ca.ET.002.03.1.2]